MTAVVATEPLSCSWWRTPRGTSSTSDTSRTNCGRGERRPRPASFIVIRCVTHSASRRCVVSHNDVSLLHMCVFRNIPTKRKQFENVCKTGKMDQDHRLFVWVSVWFFIVLFWRLNVMLLSYYYVITQWCDCRLLCVFLATARRLPWCTSGTATCRRTTPLNRSPLPGLSIWHDGDWMMEKAFNLLVLVFFFCPCSHGRPVC